MPITPTYPGVYIEEVSSGVHTITGVSTSVAAFIDMFRDGPMNEAVRITSFAEFSRIFGGLDTRSEASYGIQQFFLNGGSQAYVVRVAAEPEESDPSPALQKASVTIANHGSDILKIAAKNEGEWGNCLRVDIDRNTADPSERFNLLVTRYSGTEAGARPVSSETYLNISMDEDDPRYALDVIKDSSALIELERPSDSSPSIPPGVTGLVSGDLSDFAGLSAGSSINVTMGGETKTIIISEEAITTLSDVRDSLQTAIRRVSYSPVFTGASVSLFTVAEEGVETQYLRIVEGKRGSAYSPLERVRIENISDEDSTATDLGLATEEAGVCFSNNPQEFVLGGTDYPAGCDMSASESGGDGVQPGAAEIIGQRAEEPYTGMYALESADLFNILCIPRAADLEDDDGMDAVVSRGMAYCQERRAVMIIDIPSGTDTVSAMEQWMEQKAAYRDRNTVLYFPRLYIPDPLNEYRLRDVAASGTMAGIYSRIDSARGVWKAPAGTEAKLKGVSKLVIKREMTDAQNGILNPGGINCLRTFPVYGITSWGARTLNGADTLASEWKYIPIRRLALFLEESLYRGTKWVVFEPNDEPLWAKIRMNIGAFMMRLFRQGAFQGSTPDKAFFVKCDEETTPESDRNLGIVNIEVGFAPLKPAEFVIIKIQQMAGEL